MEFVIANFVEANDRVVVVDTGWFAQRFADIARRYTAQVEVVSGELGTMPPVRMTFGPFTSYLPFRLRPSGR